MGYELFLVDTDDTCSTPHRTLWLTERALCYFVINPIVTFPAHEVAACNYLLCIFTFPTCTIV